MPRVISTGVSPMASLNIAEAKARMCLSVFLPCFVFNDERNRRALSPVYPYSVVVPKWAFEMLSPNLLEAAHG